MSVIAEPASSSEPLPTPEAVLAQAAHENFPVALAVLGPRVRRHLMAIYGFARLVDDVGDEAEGDRAHLLDWVDGQLDLLYAGQTPEHPLLARLAQSVRACSFPEDPLRRLVRANRQDQLVSRYETFDDLLGYCQLSAAPVGELVLHVFDAATPGRVALSDLVCAGLQVIEHLQDVREDHARGRVYLPQEDLRQFGCAEEDLGGSVASSPLRAVVEWEARRAGALLEAGGPLARELRGRARLAVAGFVAGGRAALQGLRRAGYDVGAGRPTSDRRAFAIAFAAAVAGR
jgi:squalene synthase HpnC